MAVATHSTALRLSLRAAALRRSVPAIGSRSKASGLQDFLVLGGDLHLRDGIPPGPRSRGLLLVEGLALDLALALQALDEVLVLPAELVGEVGELAEAALGAQAQHLEGGGHDHALLAIEGVRDALEALQAVECSRPARCLWREAENSPSRLAVSVHHSLPRGPSSLLDP